MVVVGRIDLLAEPQSFDNHYEGREIERRCADLRFHCDDVSA